MDRIGPKGLFRILGLTIILGVMTGYVSAEDFVIKDDDNQPLFVVNGTGEKQILNGNLYLNENVVRDRDGPVQLKGDAELLGGNLRFSQSNFSIISDGDSVISYNSSDKTNILTPSGIGTRTVLYDSANRQDILRAIEGGEVEIPNGNLDMRGNEITRVGGMKLGFANLSDYPVGCGTEEAVRVIGDTLDCVSLNPGGTVETGGGSKGEVAFFLDRENITGSDNFYWNNSANRLGIGIESPTSTLDVNGQMNLRGDLQMNGEDISNPGLVEGVEIGNPGNSISILNNRYRISSGAIGEPEISQNSITATGNELDASVAGTQLNLESGSLNVQDIWVNEQGDTMTGDLKIRDRKSLEIQGNNGNTKGVISTGGENLVIRSTSSNNVTLRNDAGQTVLKATDTGNIEVPNGDIGVSGNTDSVDLDNPGNAIQISENSYAIPSGSIDSDEISENGVTNTELNNSNSYTVGSLTSTGNVQVRGNLDVFGTIRNTDVQNLNVNGSILPPEGFSDTFDLGSPNRAWRNIYIGSDLDIGDTTLSESNLDALEDGIIQNNELENSLITFNAGSGLSGGGTPSLGGSVSFSHADTSTVSEQNDLSGGNVIQDFSFDGFGHTTSITTKDLDSRYYTESESASRFVNRSGDSMNGNLDLDQNNLYLDESSNNPWLITGSNNLALTRGNTGGAEIIYRSSSDTLEIGSNNAGAGLKINGNLNMNDYSIENFFDHSKCSTGNVIAEIYDNGTYRCISITGSAEDDFVNEDGDSMTGNLNMQGSNLENVGTINASNIQREGSKIGTLFVDESGDSMSGSLNMQNNHIDNLNYLEMNSEAEIKVDGTDTIRMDTNNNVEVPKGNLDVSGNKVVEVGGTADAASGDIRMASGTEIVARNGDNDKDITLIEAKGNGFDDINIGTNARVTNVESRFIFLKGETRLLGNNIALQGGYISNDGDEEGLQVDDSGNVGIPNGNLNVNNQLSVGSTECNTGEYLDGDGTCTSVSGSTSDIYVKESGDTMTGNLDMNGNKLQNIGSGNIDIDPNGAGNINMRNEQIQNADIFQSEDMIVGSYSTGTSKVDGNDLYVQDDVEVGGNFVGAGADVAEKIKNESKMDPGTVVEISGNMSIGKTDKARDTEVAGVVSSDPAMVMAKNRDGVPVAMTGTVPVKATMENGEITPGDMLTTSTTPGKAMKCNNMDRCEGSVIGKAMEPAEEAGKVRMLVSMG